MMRRFLILAVVAVLASGLTLAQSKDDELLRVPDYTNDWQEGPATAATPQITEDFEGDFLADGWTSVDDTGTGNVTWGDLDHCGECNYANGSAGAACVSSDSFGTSTYDASLVTPTYDFSASVNSGMEVQVNFQNFAGYDYFYIDCSTDGGATWTNFLTWNEDHGPFTCGGPGEMVSLDLSALDGEAAVSCRFRFYDPVPHWNWFTVVDDFTLVSDGVITGGGGGDGGGVPATTGIGLALLVLALGGGSAYFLRRK